MTKDCNAKGGINLAQGLCDTEIPEVVRRATQRAIESGPNTYVSHTGLPELKQAIAAKLSHHNQLDFDPSSEIVITNGASGAFWATCLSLLDPGDELLLFEPFYGYHLAQLRACGLGARFIHLEPPQFAFDEAALEAAHTPRTRAIVVSTPNNPSGKVFSEDELRAVARFAERHNLWIISDEIYEHFVYDGRRHISPACVGDVRERCITISGLSKTLSITGWRIGFCAASAPIAERIALASDVVYICAPAPLQMGVALGLQQLPDEFYRQLASDHQRKRDTFCSALSDAGLSPINPEGAYYVLADASSLPGETAVQRATHLLDRTGVAAVAGSAFFEPRTNNPGENLLRFCFAKTDAVLNEACQRLRKWR